MTSSSAEKHGNSDDKMVAKKKPIFRSRLFFLVTIVVSYTIFGAMIFGSLEHKSNDSKDETQIADDVMRSKLAKTAFLQRAALGLSEKVDRKNWTLMVERLLGYYMDDVKNIDISLLLGEEANDDEDEKEAWDFWRSLLYAGSIYTTIGPASRTPSSAGGKLFTILYGLVGIPLCLILLAEVGKLLARCIRRAVKNLKKNYYGRKHPNLRELWPPHNEVEFMTGFSSLAVVGMAGIIYALIGAFVYNKWENGSSFMEAIYYIFMLMSTIGLGDSIPSHPAKLIFTSIYLLIGLSLISTGFTILQDILEYHITHATGKLDITTETLDLDEPSGVTDSHAEIQTLNNNNTDSADKRQASSPSKYITDADIEQEFITPTQAGQSLSAKPDKEKTNIIYISSTELELLGKQDKSATGYDITVEQITPQHMATKQDKVGMVAEAVRENTTPVEDEIVEETIVTSSAAPANLYSKPAPKPKKLADNQWIKFQPHKPPMVTDMTSETTEDVTVEATIYLD